MDPICIIFVRGSILKSYSTACAQVKSVRVSGFYAQQVSEETIVGYGDQVIQIPSNYHEHGKIDRPKITKLMFFQVAEICARFAVFCARFVGCNLYGLDQKTKNERFWPEPLWLSQD